MASFIKGTKIWNRIEKKFLITDHGKAETGLCGAFPLDSTVCFTLEAMTADHVKMIVFADADGEKKEFEMSKSEGGGFFLELPMNKISKKSGLFFYEYLLKNAHGEFFVVRDNADFTEKIMI